MRSALIWASASALGLGCFSAADDTHEPLGRSAPALSAEQFSVEIPVPRQPPDMLLSATELLRLNDRTKLGSEQGTVLAASLGETHLAAEASVRGSLMADGRVFLGSRSEIRGTLSAVGPIDQQDGVRIGTLESVGSVPSEVLTFPIPAPGASGGDVRLEPDQTRTLAPGAYGALDIKSRADVFLSAGAYYFDSFNVEPQAELFMDKSAGPIQIYVDSGFQFKGSFVDEGGAAGDQIIAYLGSSEAYVQGPFLGTLVAPNAEIALHRPSDNAAHMGAFFGKRIQVFSDSTVLHLPFPWGRLGPDDGDDDDDGDILTGDPNFDPVGPADVPPTTPPADPSDINCPADFEAIIDPNVDANGDGLPDIVRIVPRPTEPGCPPPTFCERVVLPDGSEQFNPVPSTPVFSPEIPIPVGAMTLGCAAQPAASVCPILSSTGLQAEGCAEEPEDPNCQTVTLCPDPGSFEDPDNPDVRREFEGESLDALPNIIPPGAGDFVAGEVLQILERLSPLYINPCEWQPVVDQFNFDVDIRGSGKEGGETCRAASECKSQVCENPPAPSFCVVSNQPCTVASDCPSGAGACEPHGGVCLGGGAPCRPGQPDCGAGNTCQPTIVLSQVCGEAKSPVELRVDEGSSSWNVKFDAGVRRGNTSVRRVVFFPSTEFDVVVDADAHLRATAFGRVFDLFQLDILSEISECGFNFDWFSRSGDDDFQITDGLIRENLGVGAFVPGNVSDIQAQSDPGASAACEQQLVLLQQAEQRANEAFHDAAIASTFYNLAGPSGSVVTSEAAAQGFIDNYVAAVDQYEAELAAYEPAQQAALDHLVAGRVLDFLFEVELAFTRGYGIGPFNPSLEIGIYGRAGLRNVDLENSANTHFTNTADTPCASPASECLELGVKGSATPQASVGLFAFVGGGVNLVIAGGRVGIRGELDLANFQLPTVAEFTLRRATLPASALLTAIPSIPPPLNAPELGPLLTAAEDLLANELFELAPGIAQYTAPFAIGSKLDPIEGPTVEGQFLSGRIKLWAKAWFLFVTKRYEKTLVSWDGRQHEWHIGEPETGDATDENAKIRAIKREIGMLAAPNMVLLPKLALLPVTGVMDATAASQTVNDALDTQVTEGFSVPFDAHHEEDLGLPWMARSSGGRCEDDIDVPR